MCVPRSILAQRRGQPLDGASPLPLGAAIAPLGRPPGEDQPPHEKGQHQNAVTDRGRKRLRAPPCREAFLLDSQQNASQLTDGETPADAEICRSGDKRRSAQSQKALGGRGPGGLPFPGLALSGQSRLVPGEAQVRVGCWEEETKAPVAEGSPSSHPSALCPGTRPQPRVSRGRETIAPRAAGLGGASHQAAGMELRLQWAPALGPSVPHRWNGAAHASPAFPATVLTAAGGGGGALRVKARSPGTGWSRGVAQALWPGSALGQQSPTSGLSG